MDKDQSSIGGVENPLEPTKQLYKVSVIMDVVAVLLSLLVSGTFTVCIAIYIICSRLYSYRGVRLKQYPIAGYLTVILNQGALTYFMVFHGTDDNLSVHMPWAGLLGATFLIGGFYPITQVYQHEADRNDGVTTISMMLGTKGTFLFCIVMYTLALLILSTYYTNKELYRPLLVLVIFFLPVIIYFLRWTINVWKNERNADFKNTMRMNWLASTCTSLAFLIIILLQQFG